MTMTIGLGAAALFIICYGGGVGLSVAIRHDIAIIEGFCISDKPDVSPVWYLIVGSCKLDQ